MLKGDVPQVQFIVGGNEPGAGTMGLMGRNLLSFADTEYDLANGVIRFLVPEEGCAKSNMAYWAGSAPVTEIELLSQSRSRTPAIRAHVKLNGTELVALFDTGATTVVSLRAARRAGVAEADMRAAGFAYGVGSGSVKAWTAAFAKFELGGEAILNNRLRVADFDLGEADLLLGVDFFLSHRIYISKAQEKMFITYNGGPVFALNRSESASNAASSASAADPAASTAQAAVTADQLARRGAASAARRDYARALADLDQAIALEPASAAFFAQRSAILEHCGALRRRWKTWTRPWSSTPPRPRHAFGAPSCAFARRTTMARRPTSTRSTRRCLRRRRCGCRCRAPISISSSRHRRSPSSTSGCRPHPNEFKRDEALNSRCWIRAMLGIELDKAIDDCDDAIDSDSRNSNYFDSRGWVYLRQGKYKKALADFDRSLELQPEAAWSLYGRGLTRARLGDAGQAETDLAAARKLRPDIATRVAHAGLLGEPAPKP